jgi:hypothetical protein
MRVKEVNILIGYLMKVGESIGIKPRFLVYKPPLLVYKPPLLASTIHPAGVLPYLEVYKL